MIDEELEKIELLFNSFSHESNQYVALQMLAANGYSCEDLAKYILKDFNITKIEAHFNTLNTKIIYRLGNKTIILIFLECYKILHDPIRGSHVFNVKVEDAEEKLYNSLVVFISINILIQKLYTT